MALLAKRLSTLRRPGGFGQDVVVALGFAVVAAGQIGAQLRHSPAPALAVGAVLAVVGALVFRRRSPAVALAVALVAMVLFIRFAEVHRFTSLAVAIAVLFYSLAVHGPGRHQGPIAAVLLAVLAGAIAMDSHTRGVPNGAVTVLLFGALPLASGFILRNRQALNLELRATTAALEHSRRERERQVVVSERMRVARELHDVVAHSVSVMVIQAGAARRVSVRDRGRAVEALRSVQASGREALAEMRFMLGALRRDGNGSDDSPTPGLDRLDELIARARDAGLEVRVCVQGQPEPLSSGLDLVAYRVVQEALTNTLKHANADGATVLVRYAGRALELQIHDSGRGRQAGMPLGHGIIGMRERVSLYGGEFEAGPLADGGFAVRARLPLSGTAA
jgi:signal transduction histidine kinase